MFYLEDSPVETNRPQLAEGAWDFLTATLSFTREQV